MNRFTPDGRIKMDSTTIGEIIRETREHGTAERVLITITTPAGNEVVVTLQPTYDATATPSPIDDPVAIVSPVSDDRAREIIANFPGPLTLNLHASGYPRPEN